MHSETPSPEMLRRLLKYNPDTGKLFWRVRSPNLFTDGKHTAAHRCNAWNGRYADKEAFTTKNGRGYRSCVIFYRGYLAHRVIFAMQTGAWPVAEIDHINHSPSDNRWNNLRAATRLMNCQNTTLRKSNRSGVCGVIWDEINKKWRAKIKANGKTLHLGRYADKDDASAARKAAEKKYEYHPNHGSTAA